MTPMIVQTSSYVADPSPGGHWLSQAQAFLGLQATNENMARIRHLEERLHEEIYSTRRCTLDMALALAKLACIQSDHDLQVARTERRPLYKVQQDQLDLLNGFNQG